MDIKSAQWNFLTQFLSDIQKLNHTIVPKMAGVLKDAKLTQQLSALHLMEIPLDGTNTDDS